MIFGVGVEGPSDFQFWSKVLHKYFYPIQFDIRNMKNRGRLIDFNSLENIGRVSLN